jgi:hypothetical protein
MKFKILIKFPTRSRPNKFINTLNMYYKFLDDLDNVKFIISCDVDDASMNNYEIQTKLNSYKNLSYYYSGNKSKVEAINSNLENLDFDILLLASDDMIPVVYGYDKIIRNIMLQNFPDTDGVIWFNDGVQGLNLNTLSVMGIRYYKRFNYIYHPSYKSLYCDNEFTEVSEKLGNVVYCDTPIITHQHHSTNLTSFDNLYLSNERYKDADHLTWVNRKNNNYE